MLYLLDEAFEGTTDWASLLGNLRSVTPQDWVWVPQGGHRRIRDIVQHVGSCKFMYHDYAFGSATMTWEDPLVAGGAALETTTSAIAWLREGQERLLRSVGALDADTELERLRLTNWGEQQETRWIIASMIAHDFYHAGEINHLRSLHQANDQWANESGKE
jgi:hypothetical protein